MLLADATRALPPALSRLATPIVLLLALAFSLFGVIPSGAARQADPGFSPASGPAQVIAQGVVALPEGDVVWRTVRTRALLPQDAPFEERPLGIRSGLVRPAAARRPGVRGAGPAWHR